METTGFVAEVPIADATAGARVAEAGRVPWYCKAVVFAATCIFVGIVWDISWHETIGRDTFWTPAHLCIHLGGSLGGLVCGWLVLKTTFFGTESERAASVSVWGFRGPLGAWVTIWGALALITSAPFDNWWHNAYGLDVKILSPPHSVLAAGMYFLVFGGLLQVLGLQNREAAGGRTAGRWLYVFTGGILLCMASIMIMERTFPNQQHTGDFYRTSMLVFPFFIFMIARPARVRMPATTVTAVYMLLMALAVWVLPLFEASPKLGPITNPVTRMVPPLFPVLLVLPALGIDLAMILMARRQTWWSNAIIVLLGGTLFAGIFGLVQWHFSGFLLSPAANNWFFGGTSHFPFNSSPDWFTRYWREGADLLTTRAVLKIWAIALVSSAIGLAMGNGMARVKR